MTINNIRGQIAALKTEAEQLTAQPVSRADVEQAVRTGVRGCEPFSEAAILQTLQRLAAGQPAPLLAVRAGPVVIDLLPVFIRMMGAAAVTKALLKDIDSIAEGLQPEARTQRLAAIVTQLRTLENDEEALIRAGGEVTPRRTDADPAAVLAL